MSAVHDAIVVGAGPAGMAAAIRLARGGASVLLLDEQAAPGGQIYRGVEANAGDPRLAAILGKDYTHGASLVAALRVSDTILSLSTSVWQLDADGSVWVRGPDGIARHRARHLVLATGALERPVPVPGWTLPGVMTVGAMQILLKTGAALPPGRLVLAGTGPLFYLYAAQALAFGIDPKNLVLLDTAPAMPDPAALLRGPAAIWGEGWRYLAKGLGLMRNLKSAGIGWLRGVTDIAIAGEGRAERVAFRYRGRAGSIAADVVGLHQGVIPHLHAARSLGLAERWDDSQAAFAPVLDAHGRSSLETVHVVGDAAGIAGARAAEHSGRIAALAILDTLGRIAPAARADEMARERKACAAHLAVRPLLEALYRPPAALAAPNDDTIVCRCESVTAGAVRDAVGGGAPGPNQVKAFLRCGMGPCQGRLCGPTVSAIVAAETGQSMAETGHYRIRPPLKPLTLGELAEAAAVARDGPQ